MCNTSSCRPRLDKSKACSSKKWDGITDNNRAGLYLSLVFGRIIIIIIIVFVGAQHSTASAKYGTDHQALVDSKDGREEVEKGGREGNIRRGYNLTQTKRQGVECELTKAFHLSFSRCRWFIWGLLLPPGFGQVEKPKTVKRGLK